MSGYPSGYRNSGGQPENASGTSVTGARGQEPGNTPGVIYRRGAMLIATCELHGVDPQAYLSDVLVRLASHPRAQLDELLPHRWRPLDAA